MNPIKTPREMLFELVELPRFAAGQTVVKEFMPQIARAVAKFKQIYGKSPSPEDVAALKTHLEGLSRPTTPLRTGPQAQVRAQYELATDPNLINPNAPDAFLTKAMTGRTQKGTALAPKPLDINDPNVIANIEQKQVAGALDDIVQPSTTPGSDAIARIATGMENQALGQGKIPLIDQIKLEFFKRNKRYPSDEELEVMIAEFNPLRHQYGEKGLSILGERPATAKGMRDWVSRARTEGISERTLSKPPSDYSQYAKDELMLQQGQLPGVRPLTDKRINPDRPDGFADGGSVSPSDMEAYLIAIGAVPQRFKEGRRARRGIDDIKDFFAGMRNAPIETYKDYLEVGQDLGIADPRSAEPTQFGVTQGRFVPQYDVQSPAYKFGNALTGFIGDPINALFPAAGKTAKVMGRAIARNPVKSSAAVGAAPSESFAGPRSIMEDYK